VQDERQRKNQDGQRQLPNGRGAWAETTPPPGAGHEEKSLESAPGAGREEKGLESTPGAGREEKGLESTPGAGREEKGLESTPGVESEEQFAFLQEKVKSREKKRGERFFKVVWAAVLGLVFGGFACAGFYALTPLMENALRERPGEVTIPEDEELPEVEPTEDEVVPEMPVLTVEDYKEMMQSLYLVARDAEQCLVSVQAVGGAWVENDARDAGSVTGIIAADNGWEILIVADHAVCANVAEEENPQWAVTFYDGASFPASLKKRDKNRGLAVFTVNRMQLSENTKNGMQTVVWGNSNVASRGDVVIALGNMFGYGDGLGYGVISSKKYDEQFADASCGVLATDIAVSSGGTGVLVNQRGEVLGLVRGSIWPESANPTANALAISDLKPVLEMLLNGESVPYVGIRGTSVTEIVSAEQGLPRGMYVTQVVEDSPAMYAGIQNGDIIQKVGGTEVAGASSYEKAVLKCKTGAQVKVKGKRRGNGGYVDVEFVVTVGSQE